MGTACCAGLNASKAPRFTSHGYSPVTTSDENLTCPGRYVSGEIDDFKDFFHGHISYIRAGGDVNQSADRLVHGFRDLFIALDNISADMKIANSELVEAMHIMQHRDDSSDDDSSEEDIANVDVQE